MVHKPDNDSPPLSPTGHPRPAPPQGSEGYVQPQPTQPIYRVITAARRASASGALQVCKGITLKAVLIAPTRRLHDGASAYRKEGQAAGAHHRCSRPGRRARCARSVYAAWIYVRWVCLPRRSCLEVMAPEVPLGRTQICGLICRPLYNPPFGRKPASSTSPNFESFFAFISQRQAPQTCRSDEPRSS